MYKLNLEIMEILSSCEMKRKRWSVNGITYYYRAGKLCQCDSKRPRWKRGRKKDGTRLILTPLQEKVKVMFRMMGLLKACYFKQTGELPAWDVVPGLPGQTRLTKFHHANFGACDERGVSDYPGVRFTGGVLLKPVHARVSREGWLPRVTWENREDRF